MALFLEKEHLRDAEDSDYQLMSDLIQRRFHVGDDIDERFDNNAFFLTVSDETSEYRRWDIIFYQAAFRGVVRAVALTTEVPGSNPGIDKTFRW